MKQKPSAVRRTVAFWAVFLVLFFLMTQAFSTFPDYRSYQSIGGFYLEEEGSLDAIYLGSSNCYAFWSAPVAWHNYGLKVYPYASPSQPFYALEYLIRETRKTQPDAMYIININSVESDDLTPNGIHYLINYMPESENRQALTNHLADLLGYNMIEKLEFRFPWLRMRELWLDRIKNGPVPEPDGLMGASTYEHFLEDSEDITARYLRSDRKKAIPMMLTESVIGLLDYCDEEGIRVLFVSVPRAEESEEALGRINAVRDIIRSHGRDVLDMNPIFAELSLDLTQDYYNDKHTNIHGSVKFTNYLCEYLIGHCGLRNRQGGNSARWDEAWRRYAEIIAPWTLDIELDSRRRDSALPVPSGLTASAGGEASVRISWEAVPGADGYRVYRKTGKTGAWELLGETSETAFEDTGLRKDETRYTVAAQRAANGEIYYGNFWYQGVEAA